MRILWFMMFAFALASAGGSAEERFPIGHPDQGLPNPEFVLTPYHNDPDHALNRVFRASFLVTLVPEEVGLVLPREHGDPAEFFRKPWYFAVRAGPPAGKRLFGGDARLLPRDGFTSEEAKAFSQALTELDGEAIRTLKHRPALAVLFQHDLLRVAQRLAETGRNRELLPTIATTVKEVAFNSDQLGQIPSTYELGLKFGSLDLQLPANLLRVEPSAEGSYVELLRSSTSLFSASKSTA